MINMKFSMKFPRMNTLGLFITASILAPTLISAQSSFCSSPVDNIHFELVTGKVFTAPEDMLDSRPGTLMLTDCIDLCRANNTCRAANFETGLCVLFSSSAQQFPGKNPCKLSQLNHNARKKAILLNKPPYENNMHYHITSYTKKM
jgi:hypothetical protein